MTDNALTPQQLAVICALSSGATMTQAAAEAGIHRNTIANWRRNQLPFQYAFAHAQYDRALYYREQAIALVDLAFQAINEILTDPKTPASVRLRAALAIIDSASTPPDPQKQVLLDIEKITTQKIQLVPPPAEDAPSVHNSAQPPSPEPEKPQPVHNAAQFPSAPHPLTTKKILHNPAQPATPRPLTKVGRNEPCPCGSGQKFKRCCLNLTVRPEFVQRLACHPGVSRAKG